MDFFEAVEKRYSYRGDFTDEALPREALEKILEAGIRAPSGLNRQTTTVLAVTEPALRQQLADILPTPATKSAQALLVMLSEGEGAKADFEVEDYAACTENILLAVAALGYASVWIDGQVRNEAVRTAMAQLLAIPPEYMIRALLPIGVAKTPGVQKAKKPLSERVRFEHF